jgi:hypothetical protein
MIEGDGRITTGGFTGKIYNLNERLPERCLCIFPNITYHKTNMVYNWEYYSFESKIPLNIQDEKCFFNNNYDGNPFKNDLVCCRAEKNIMIFARGRKALYYFIDHFLEGSDLNLKMKSCSISVDAFIKQIAKDKTYIITNISAYYDKAIADSLKSLRLYGNDIGSSELFSQNIGQLSVYRCGIKEITLTEEMISISTDGSLYINLIIKDLPKINMLFRHLRQNNYLTE